MKTRTMGWLIVGLGALGWAAGLGTTLTGFRLGAESDDLPRHMLAGVIPTLVLVPVLVWLMVFARLATRVLARGAPPSAVATRRSVNGSVATCFVALLLTLGNFVVGFLTATGDVSPRGHGLFVVAWLFVVALALLLAYRALSALEDEADRMASTDRG